MKYIGDRAFYYCTKLTSVTIGENVTSIDNNAFANCTGLTEVTINSATIYNELTSNTACGRLIYRAKTVKVEKSIVDSNTNFYLITEYIKTFKW